MHFVILYLFKHFKTKQTSILTPQNKKCVVKGGTIPIQEWNIYAAKHGWIQNFGKWGGRGKWQGVQEQLCELQGLLYHGTQPPASTLGWTDGLMIPGAEWGGGSRAAPLPLPLGCTWSQTAVAVGGFPSCAYSQAGREHRGTYPLLLLFLAEPSSAWSPGGLGRSSSGAPNHHCSWVGWRQWQWWEGWWLNWLKRGVHPCHCTSLDLSVCCQQNRHALSMNTETKQKTNSIYRHYI